MIKTIHIIILLLVAATVFVQSCDKERDPCLLPKTTLVRAGAYKRIDDTSSTVRDTALPSPVFTALNDSSQNNSFILLAGRNKFTFQLSDLKDSCRWVLQPDTLSAVRDTITFFYQRQLHFLSNACGYTFYFNIDSIYSTHNAIDSIKLVTKDVTSNAGTENFSIYF